MKKLLKIIFCPISCIYDISINEKMTDIKNPFIKCLFLVLIVAIVIFLFYCKEIFNLWNMLRLFVD